MRRALELAALGRGLVSPNPLVGAVVVRDGTVVGEGWHRGPGTPHAEVNALAAAGDRAPGATLYCTLEPCVMCAGALVTARVRRLVFGARDLRFGGVRSKFQVADSTVLNHQVEVVEGVLAVECVELLRAFFEAQRRK